MNITDLINNVAVDKTDLNNKSIKGNSKNIDDESFAKKLSFVDAKANSKELKGRFQITLIDDAGSEKVNLDGKEVKKVQEALDMIRQSNQVGLSDKEKPDAKKINHSDKKQDNSEDKEDESGQTRLVMPHVDIHLTALKGKDSLKNPESTKTPIVIGADKELKVESKGKKNLKNTPVSIEINNDVKQSKPNGALKSTSLIFTHETVKAENFEVNHKINTSNVTNVAAFQLTDSPEVQPSLNQNHQLQTNLSTRFGDASWQQDFNNKVFMMAKNSNISGHTVHMHVNPPELGPVKITLHLNDGSTQATFTSAHAPVRQAIEGALESLNKQFQEAGLSLGQTDVKDEGHNDQAESGAFSDNPKNITKAIGPNSTDSISISNSESMSIPIKAIRSDRVIDTFA